MVTPLNVKRVEAELVFQTPYPQLFRDIPKGNQDRNSGGQEPGVDEVAVG